MRRTDHISGLDLDDLATVRVATKFALDIGHHRRLLAIYGDHLNACAVRNGGECDCGFLSCFVIEPRTGTGEVHAGDPR